MAFTTLDLPAQLKTLCVKGVEAQEKVKKEMGGSKKIPGLQAACKVACQKEIDRQMQIYNREEGQFVSEITRIHAESKALAADIAKGGDAKVLQQKCQQLEANSTAVHDLAGELVAHQGFRAGCWSEQKTADMALGAATTKAMEEQFVKSRAPMIAAVAGVKDLRVKIDEFVKRAWDLAQAHAAEGGTVDVTAIAKEIASRESEFAKVAEDVERRKTQLNTMQNFVVGMNSKKMTKPLADIEFKRSSDYDKQTKLTRAQVKTLGVALETLQKRLGEAAKNPKILPLMAALEKHYKAANDGVTALASSQEAYNKKIADAKKLFP